MIIKPRTYPIYIKKLEALLRRIPSDNSNIDFIKESLAKRKAGYNGEQNLDYHLSFLDGKQYNILHDVRLFDGTHYFQLDTVILSKTFILILEVKNIVGTLFFDSNFSQLIRYHDEKKESFPDPILQVERQGNQFRKWLEKSKYANIPIETIVVISKPRTILETTPENEFIYQKVIHSAKIPYTVSKFNQIYTKNLLSTKQLLYLSKKVLNEHSPLKIDILNQYNMSKQHLLKGVICANCKCIPIDRVRGKWRCSNCHFVSKDAHLSAIEDYYLLISSTITNQRLRDFLNIGSTSVANKLLSSMNLKNEGTNKGRIYELDYNN